MSRRSDGTWTAHALVDARLADSLFHGSLEDGFVDVVVAIELHLLPFVLLLSSYNRVPNDPVERRA